MSGPEAAVLITMMRIGFIRYPAAADRLQERHATTAKSVLHTFVLIMHPRTERTIFSYAAPALRDTPRRPPASQRYNRPSPLVTNSVTMSLPPNAQRIGKSHGATCDSSSSPSGA